MGDNPRGVSRKNSSRSRNESEANLPARRRSRSSHRDSIDYSSCTARSIADCVALCCCPCAVVNFLTFTLVKVPYMVGRRCIAAGKRRRRRRRMASKSCDEEDHKFVVEKDGSLRKEEEDEEEKDRTVGMMEIEGRVSARVEAERVWLELYQMGHLGFGRVSYTGIQ